MLDVQNADLSMVKKNVLGLLTFLLQDTSSMIYLFRSGVVCGLFLYT